MILTDLGIADGPRKEARPYRQEAYVPFLFLFCTFFPGEQAYYPSVLRGIFIEMGYMVGMVEIDISEGQNLQ